MVSDTINPLILNEINKISSRYNKTNNEILKEAILVYKNYLELLDEFKDWEAASEEDFSNFEQKNLQ
jgi:hypothetical protein